MNKVIIISVVLCALGGGLFWYVRNEPASDQVERTSDCLKLAEDLKTCKPSQCTFSHPMTRDKITRKVLGEIDGKCEVEENVPGGLFFICRYDEPQRLKVSNYYKEYFSQVDGKRLTGFSASVSLGEGPSDGSVYADGQEISMSDDDFMQDYMKNGICFIEGR
jgi:hypothetical protein